jgi:hypothetical protein
MGFYNNNIKVRGKSIRWREKKGQETSAALLFMSFSTLCVSSAGVKGFVM